MARPIVLIVRDGWGVSDHIEGNAVLAANTPMIDSYRENYPHCMIGTSGESVGLPAGNQGSSEVGHLNLGAGRIVKQEVVRVDEAIADGSLFTNELLVKAADQVKTNGGALHLMGLVQDQGVHAMNTHFCALLEFAKKQGIEKVYIHFFADGRDTPPQSALTFMEELEEKIAEIGTGQVASVIGRYWAMDRDKKWDRVDKAYRALVFGEGLQAASGKAAIEAAYSRIEKQRAEYASNENAIIETDEFILPTLIAGDDGEPIGTIRNGDAVVHLNYRQDRAVQLAMAFVDKDFTHFERAALPDLFFVGLTRYFDEFENAVIAPMNMKNIFGEVLCAHELRQLRISETQKFRHVTSFFNSKLEEPFCFEDRILIKSLSIAEDKAPEMRAPEVADLAVTAIRDGIDAARAQGDSTEGVVVTRYEGGDTDRRKDTYDVIVLNFANCDMVGHRGFFDPAVKSVEAVDKQVGRVVDAVLEKGGIALVTADHGNVEQMLDPKTGKVHTAHTTADVECFYVANETSNVKLVQRGVLSDFAPTILKLLGLPQPPEMDRPTLFAD
jgi:2,3-bisphosphoglycerate-independent phosphoglycerate mutase